MGRYSISKGQEVNHNQNPLYWPSRPKVGVQSAKCDQDIPISTELFDLQTRNVIQATVCKNSNVMD